MEITELCSIAAHKSYFCLFKMHLLIISVCFMVAAFARSASSQIDLIKSSNVKIRARLQVVPNDNELPVEEIELIETYANADRRSLIEIKSPYNKGRNLKYYTTKDGHRIEYEAKIAACRLVEPKLYIEALFGPLALQGIEIIDQWLSPIDGIPDHSIGLGRLFALIQAKKIELKKATGEPYIRGKPSSRYSFSLQWAGSLQLVVDAFYTDNSSDTEGLQLPARVLVKYKERVIFMVDLDSIKSTWVKPYETLDHVDPTTLPLGLDCASVQKSRLAPGKVPSKAIFTLNAEFIDPERSSRLRKQFIAYDANQQALRRDTILESPKSVYLKSIYDLKKGRQYNMNLVLNGVFVEKQDSQDSKQSILQVEESPVRECVASELERDDYEALLPFHELAYAGSGLVRGQQVDIYEMSSATLPVLFFSPSRFVDTDNKWQMFDANEAKTDQKYQVVYYYTRGASVERPFTQALVRVDVFRRRQLIKLVNVFNFIWRLSKAPDGDMVESLFSLHHSCSSVFATPSRQLTYSADRSIHMSMELEFLLSTPQNGNSNMLVALESGPVRNAAILRGLVASTKSLSPVQIVSLRSFLRTSSTNQTNRHTLLMNAHIALIDDEFFRPKMFSYGWIYPKFEPIQGLSSFEECFNEASRRRKGEHILFTFTDIGYCYIDDRPIFENKTDENSGIRGKVLFTYSNIFGIERNKSAIRVMEVEFVENVQSKQLKQLAWSQIKSDLMKQSIALPLVLPETMGETMATNFFFRVVRMEMHEKLEGQKSSDSISFDGLGLHSGNKLTKAEGQMDTETCRLACFKDMDCRSYSICITGQQLECTLSEVDFRKAEIVAKLDEQRQQVSRSKISHRTFSVETGDGNGVNQAVVLKVDRRCRLFKKLPVEMFAKSHKTRTSLSGQVITQLDNVQECAEKCLQMNLRYLRDLSDSDPARIKDDSIEVKWDLRRNLENWCAMFKFYDLDSTLSSKNLVEHGVFAGITKKGICLLPEGLLNVEEAFRKKDDLIVDSKLTLDMDTFTFSYINLFEPCDGVRLEPHSDSDSSSGGQSRENKRMVIGAKSIEECARACFMQTGGLVPFCKSFEFVQSKESMRVNLSGNGWHGMTLCALNSMSLADAKESGIYEKVVTTISDPRVVTRHYELRQGYMINETVLNHMLSSESNLAATTETKLRFDFSLTILIMFAAVSGLVSGAKLKEPLVRICLERHDHPIRLRRLSQDSLDQ